MWPLILFLFLCPGRDTQDDGLMYCIGNVYGSYYTSYFTSFLSSLWSFFATKVVMVLGFIHTTFYHSIMRTCIQAFERKHGHWKFTSILPMFLMVLSCINVTTVQAASIQVHTAHPTKIKSPHVSSIHLAFLFNKWKESLNKRSNFKKLLDTIEPLQPFQVGPNYAQDWEEYLAHEALRHSCQGKFTKELAMDDTNDDFSTTDPTWTAHSMVDKIDNIFTLASSVRITHLPEGLSS